MDGSIGRDILLPLIPKGFFKYSFFCFAYPLPLPAIAPGSTADALGRAADLPAKGR
jgi:hypothetical protein